MKVYSILKNVNIFYSFSIFLKKPEPFMRFNIDTKLRAFIKNFQFSDIPLICAINIYLNDI